jgi:lipopolysaccharide heptosyltransferase III
MPRSLTLHALRRLTAPHTLKGMSLYTWQYRARERYIVARRLIGRKPPPPDAAQWPPRYVACVLVGMLGDTVMCLPVLEAARDAWPQARLCAVVTPRIREMLAGVGYVDEFLVGTGDPLSIRGRERAKQTEEQLSERRFDVAILLGGDQYAPLFYRAGVPIRVGPAPCVYEPLLTHNYVVDDGQTWGPYERLGALRALGVETAHRVPRLDLDPQARVEFKRWREKSLGDVNHSYIVIHPFGSTPRQRWPLDRVPQLARQIYMLTGMRSLLVGGPEFRGVASTLSGGRSLINTVGELSISQLLAAIESGSLVASTDSGPFHMAGALGKTVIGLFRGRRPEHANRYPQARVIFGADHSCEKFCQWNRCRAEPCRQLNAISTDEVLNEIIGAATETHRPIGGAWKGED